MSGSVLKLILMAAACLGLGLSQAGSCSAQNRGRESIDALLKSIGLSKPALARAPDFSLRDPSGNIVSISGNRGNLILLNFWATWCEPCRQEMPSIEQLSRSFGGQGLTILAVNQRESAAQVLSFMKRYGLNFRAPLDADGRVAAAYRVYGIPMTYLIDGSGRFIGMKSGPRNWAASEVVELLRKLIADDQETGFGAGSIDIEPKTALPKILHVRSSGVPLRAAQDGQSAVIGMIDSGDELVPLGKVSGAGEYWYIVRTSSGTTGWLREAEVEQIKIRK